MQAVLNANKESAYAKFNGHTFTVVRLDQNNVTLVGMGWDLLNTEVDFSFTEVLIVDLDKEMRSLESRIEDVRKGLAPSATESLYYVIVKTDLTNMQRYCIANGFEFNHD